MRGQLRAQCKKTHHGRRKLATICNEISKTLCKKQTQANAFFTVCFASGHKAGTTFLAGRQLGHKEKGRRKIRRPETLLRFECLPPAHRNYVAAVRFRFRFLRVAVGLRRRQRVRDLRFVR